LKINVYINHGKQEYMDMNLLCRFDKVLFVVQGFILNMYLLSNSYLKYGKKKAQNGTNILL